MDSFTCSSKLHTCNADICASVQSLRTALKDLGGMSVQKETKCAEKRSGARNSTAIQKSAEQFAPYPLSVLAQ